MEYFYASTFYYRMIEFLDGKNIFFFILKCCCSEWNEICMDWNHNECNNDLMLLAMIRFTLNYFFYILNKRRFNFIDYFQALHSSHKIKTMKNTRKGEKTIIFSLNRFI